MQSEELLNRLEEACRDAGGYVIHPKDALARHLGLDDEDRMRLTAGLKELAERGKVVVQRRGRAGLLVALPGVPLPELQKNEHHGNRRAGTRRTGKAARAPSTRGAARKGAVSGSERAEGAPRAPGSRRLPARAAGGVANGANRANASTHFCPWCGKPIQLAWNYCANCGEALETVKDLYD